MWRGTQCSANQRKWNVKKKNQPDWRMKQTTKSSMRLCQASFQTQSEIIKRITRQKDFNFFFLSTLTLHSSPSLTLYYEILQRMIWIWWMKPANRNCFLFCQSLWSLQFAVVVGCLVGFFFSFSWLIIKMVYAMLGHSQLVTLTV